MVASGITVGFLLLSPSKYRYIDSIDWSFPLNCTFHIKYITIPYMIPMRDGVNLSTDVHIPRNIDNSMPIILFRTPYDKNRIDPAGLIEQGYIVVIASRILCFKGEVLFREHLGRGPLDLNGDLAIVSIEGVAQVV